MKHESHFPASSAQAGGGYLPVLKAAYATNRVSATFIACWRGGVGIETVVPVPAAAVKMTAAECLSQQYK
jgi:hypothetical protein